MSTLPPYRQLVLYRWRARSLPIFIEGPLSSITAYRLVFSSLEGMLSSETPSYRGLALLAQRNMTNDFIDK